MKDLLVSKKFNIVWSACALIIMWAVWLIAAACAKNEAFFPPFKQSAKEFFTLAGKAFFWKALGATLLRTVIAFLISFALASACATVAVVCKPFASFMRPIAAVCRTLPTMAVLLLIWVLLVPNSSRYAPVAVCFLVLFPMIYSQLYGAIEGVDGKLIEMAKVYGISRGKVIAKIYLPHVAPSTVENSGTNLAFGIKLIISAEVMSFTYTAIGGLMSQSQMYFNYARLAALTLWSVFLGIGIEALFRAVSHVAFKWRRV